MVKNLESISNSASNLKSNSTSDSTSNSASNSTLDGGVFDLSLDEEVSTFLKQKDQFQFGALPTEKPHPEPMNLSYMVQKDLKNSILLLRNIDLKAILTVENHLNQIINLQRAIAKILQQGNRVYLCGCGATGRLCLSLESLWREWCQEQPSLHKYLDSVVAFMAGGDTALVRAIENFEDFTEYGAKQLAELNFTENDLLISITEGGETPFVIGATLYAVNLSSCKPFFIYCNPDDLLKKLFDRSRKVINHPQIEKINLTVGPMSLAGSTRLQACTVQNLAVGLALFTALEQQEIKPVYQEFVDFFSQVDFTLLEPLIQAEANVYQQNQFVLYETDQFGLSILTDTTERSPTFSLTPFENIYDNEPLPSLCYLSLSETFGADDAWQKLLFRSPRVLNWSQYMPFTSDKYIGGFNFSQQIKTIRSKNHQLFEIKKVDNHLYWQFMNHSLQFPLNLKYSFMNHLLLKVLLNIHSTLLMGLLGRYERNLMTWVKPSCYKLIDRAARYVLYLLEQDNITRHSYEDVVQYCFSCRKDLKNNESIVLKTYQNLIDPK